MRGQSSSCLNGEGQAGRVSPGFEGRISCKHSASEVGGAGGVSDGKEAGVGPGERGGVRREAGKWEMGAEGRAPQALGRGRDLI